MRDPPYPVDAAGVSAANCYRDIMTLEIEDDQVRWGYRVDEAYLSKSQGEAMRTDPVVKEVRAAREKLYAAHGGNLEAYVGFLRQRQQEEARPVADKKARVAAARRRRAQ